MEDFEQVNYSNTPLGPSSRSCCKVSVPGACGSGSLVGVRNGKSLVLTNAHVAGTTIGKSATCTFPFLNNKSVVGRVIMAAYSDRVMMDWCILELNELVDLPHVKLSNKAPTGEHYTGGYPRCKGPFFQRLVTRSFSHNATVWRWQPNSIGGQSGSGVHSFADNLQKGLLTWSWGGDGAGQTTRSIFMQYVQRAEIGFPRPDDLVELSNRAEDVENGFFSETNITTLPIWAELDVTPAPVDPDPKPPNTDLNKALLESAARLKAESDRLVELARSQGALNPNKPEEDCNTDITFGL
jgi:hypothetical protein